ncbi:hypothetical protein K491DRAFT_591727 [Lophiostoma macrostomum CBS 122681]|uniref:Uncharacterized protein n=1 Tax=Lophiostoma macrostomum CBS 122681 TaxID=1314788 RepID=A0A6A6TGT7_9PLEO|nr:hypothetical protein K491DRAFT_591727 [Lophiostoma macrostomum CBS 122681]
MDVLVVSETVLAAHQCSEDIELAIRTLKQDCDIWQARAAAYKAAFEAQTKQLREVIDVCVATQAELENERVNNRQRRDNSELSSILETYAVKAIHEPRALCTLGWDGALDVRQTDVEWHSTAVTQANFGHVEQLLTQRDFSRARTEIDRILPRPLSNEARIEALLLKSVICRASGPDWLLEGLAQCSEALSLCDKLSDLEFLLPKIQYHRGLCHYKLHEIAQARDASTAAEPAVPLHEGATGNRKSRDEDSDSLCIRKRRSAFDEHRTVTERYLSQLKASESAKSRRRSSSTRSRIFSGSNPARLVIPHRWTSRAAT